MLSDSKNTEKENDISISEDNEKNNKINQEDEKSISSDSSDSNKNEINANVDFYSNSSSSSVSSSINDNMEFSKALVLDSNSTKNTDKKIQNRPKRFMARPSRSFEEEIIPEKNLNKKANEYFNSSPQKQRVLHLKNFNIKKKNEKNEEIKKKLSPLSSRKRRYSLLYLGEEKTKTNRKAESVFSFRSKNYQDNKPVRKDNNGVRICKENKKFVKIKFAEPLETVQEIECLKSVYYVKVVRVNDEENMVPGDKIKCQCCTIY